MSTVILPSSRSQHLAQQVVLPFEKAPILQRAINAATIAIAGGVVTVGLFVLMAALIKQDRVLISDAPPVLFDPIIYQPEDELTITKNPIEPIMHVPAHSDHPFRFNPITDFGLIRSPISELSDQK